MSSTDVQTRAGANRPARLAVLISGNGSNLQAIIDACRSGQLNAEVVLVVSNRPGAYGLERARTAGIDTATLDHKDYADRAAFDAALAERLEQADADWIVLAGFMRILTSAFVERFLGRLINIHPSLLPKYPGLDTHARALEANDAEHGATVHFVTPTVDAGPAILQGRLAIQPDDTVDDLQRRVYTLEHQIYPQAIRWLVDGKAAFENGQATWSHRPIRSPGLLDDSGTLTSPKT